MKVIERWYLRNGEPRKETIRLNDDGLVIMHTNPFVAESDMEITEDEFNTIHRQRKKHFSNELDDLKQKREDNARQLSQVREQLLVKLVGVAGLTEVEARVLIYGALPVERPVGNVAAKGKGGSGDLSQ